MPGMKFVLASKNKHKQAELQTILAPYGIELVLQSELGLDLEVEETGTTFLDNARLKAEASAIRKTAMDTTPVKGSSRREDALINNLAQRQELEWTLQQAQLWLKTTDRALTALNKQEQLILHRLYIYPERGAIEQLCKELGIEVSSIYRHRDRALKHFTLAYYGIDE